MNMRTAKDRETIAHSSARFNIAPLVMDMTPSDIPIVTTEQHETASSIAE